MRLSKEQIHIIQEEARSIFGEGVKVRLFGSRLDNTQRGGDIDLLVECYEPIQDRLKKTLTLTARLQMELGDQPIDVLVIDPTTELKQIHKIALRTGVELGQELNCDASR